jgi:hypothetical protein
MWWSTARSRSSSSKSPRCPWFSAPRCDPPHLALRTRASTGGRRPVNTV